MWLSSPIVKDKAKKSQACGGGRKRAKSKKLVPVTPVDHQLQILVNLEYTNNNNHKINHRTKPAASG
jgi:hypothetical protein